MGYPSNHEGSTDVKQNKLLSLTPRFENLRMLEDVLLQDFYTKICDIANKSFDFGEKIYETTLVRKIVRSLLDRFSSKLITIEETKDLDSMKVEDVMESLHAFKMNLKQRKRKKSIAFKLVKEKSEEENSDDNNDDELALLTKNVKKFLKKVDKSSKSDSSYSKTTKGKKTLLKLLILLIIRR